MNSEDNQPYGIDSRVVNKQGMKQSYPSIFVRSSPQQQHDSSFGHTFHCIAECANFFFLSLLFNDDPIEFLEFFLLLINRKFQLPVHQKGGEKKISGLQTFFFSYKNYFLRDGSIEGFGILLYLSKSSDFPPLFLQEKKKKKNKEGKMQQ